MTQNIVELARSLEEVKARLAWMESLEGPTRLDPLQAHQNTVHYLTTGLPGVRGVFAYQNTNFQLGGMAPTMALYGDSATLPKFKTDPRGFSYVSLDSSLNQHMWKTGPLWSVDTGVTGWSDTDRVGLTVGGWFRVTSYPGDQQGLICAWDAFSSDASWRIDTSNLYSPVNAVAMSVSGTGAYDATQVVISTVAPSAGVWVFYVARWDPSTSLTMDFWEAGVKNTAVNTTSIVASLYYDSTLTGFIGAYQNITPAHESLNGDVGLTFVAMNLWTDTEVARVYELSRHIYGV